MYSFALTNFQSIHVFILSFRPCCSGLEGEIMYEYVSDIGKFNFFLRFLFIWTVGLLSNVCWICVGCGYLNKKRKIGINIVQITIKCSFYSTFYSQPSICTNICKISSQVPLFLHLLLSLLMAGHCRVRIIAYLFYLSIGLMCC